MMNSLDIEAVRRRFSELVAAAHYGERILITRHGRPHAMLVPVEHTDTLRRFPAALLALKGCGAGLWNEPFLETVALLRDEWPA